MKIQFVVDREILADASAIMMMAKKNLAMRLASLFIVCMGTLSVYAKVKHVGAGGLYSPWSILDYLFVMAFGSYLVTPKGWSNFFLKTFIRIIHRGKDLRGILGTHVLEARADGLSETTDCNEGIARWNGIKEVLENGKYLFITINDIHIHVVPRKQVPESDYAGFRSELASFIEIKRF